MTPARSDSVPARHHTLGDGREVFVFETLGDLSDAAASMVVEGLASADLARGRATLALAGGSTPRTAYLRLAELPRDQVPWLRTSIVFGDERCVPPDDAASNYGMAQSVLLSRIPVPPALVHRVHGEQPPEAAARGYERVLRGALRAQGTPALDHVSASAVEQPLLDVTLLGVGTDGHTASLFPGSAALDERVRWVVPVQAPASAGGARDRVTLTLPVLRASRLVLILAAGQAKRDAVAAALRDGEANPAAMVRGRTRTCWLLDAAAAGALPSPT